MGINAFTGCKNITRIIMPDSITNIDIYVFSYCEKLESIQLSKNLKSIEVGTFYNCLSLRSVSVPDGVESVKNFAFNSCENLEQVEFPDSIRNIGTGVFGNTKIEQKVDYSKEWYINNHLIYVPNVSKFTIKDGTVTIADRAFLGCTLLSEIKIPDSVKTIGVNAFTSCSLTEINIPYGVTYIGDGAFYNCDLLLNITIPDSVTTIGKSAFESCISLTNIVIPDSVTVLNQNLFYGCTLLENITISDSIKSIRCGVFDGTAFYNNSDNWVNGELYLSNHLIRVDPSVAIGKYSIESDVKSVSGHAFFDCKNLTEINIPNSVKYIEDYAFYNCESLTNVIVPDSVTRIGEGAFSGCDSLESIHIPSTVTDIDYDRYEYPEGSLPDNTIPNMLGYSPAYICCNTEICYAKEYAEQYGIEFKLCNGHETEKPNEQSVVVSIEITSNPFKLKYNYKSEVSLDGLHVIAKYSDGNEVDVTDRANVIGFDTASTGDKTAMVEFEGQSATFDYSVSYAWWQWIIRILLLGFIWY